MADQTEASYRWDALPTPLADVLAAIARVMDETGYGLNIDQSPPCPELFHAYRELHRQGKLFSE